MMKKIASALTVVGAGLPIVLRDAAGLAGVALISYGAWLIMPAVGFVVAGVLVLAGVIAISAKAG
jgi:hypothetical protein